MFKKNALFNYVEHLISFEQRCKYNNYIYLYNNILKEISKKSLNQI